MARGREAGSVHVGCSGWSYEDWVGLLYPQAAPKREWFVHYAKRFNSVELNSTFYRLPSEHTVETWAAQAPPGFVYAAKVSRFATHTKRLRDPEGWSATHAERLGALGDLLGPNLLQLPPRWRPDLPRLDEALQEAPDKLRWAVEVRDGRWLSDDLFEILARHGAALCIHDMIPDHPWERTTNWTYVRFHGPHAQDAPYQGLYGGRRLWRPADRLAAWVAEGTDTFVYFNNDQNGNAPQDATWLAERLSRRSR